MDKNKNDWIKLIKKKKEDWNIQNLNLMNNILRIDNDWTYPIIPWAKLKYFPLVSLETSTLRDTQSENTVNTQYARST